MARLVFLIGLLLFTGAASYLIFSPEGLNGRGWVESMLGGDTADTSGGESDQSDEADTAATNAEEVSPAVIEEQRAALAAATDGKGFGPQSPRALDTLDGANPVSFATAPDASQMNLCNIHFHKNAEHRGGNFTTFAGPGNGAGFGTGYVYDGALSDAELTPLDESIGANEQDALVPGDTIEIHFVHTTAQVQPGPTLGACLNEKAGNPHLRVETVVAVLVNDAEAADFTDMASFTDVNGYVQAPNIPENLGDPVAYLGSTTGPSYNTKGSPFQVSWNVRPEVIKVDISSVGAWLKDNVFEEKYAHGVRNLVTNPALISPIGQ